MEKRERKEWGETEKKEKGSRIRKVGWDGELKN